MAVILGRHVSIQMFALWLVEAAVAFALIYALLGADTATGAPQAHAADSALVLALTVSGSALSIGISLFIVAIAALNLILDFDRIEQGAAQGAPKYFEWFSAFGLLVTLVWLYLEILRLLSKLASRD